jgi:hypothetical protein
MRGASSTSIQERHRVCTSLQPGIKEARKFVEAPGTKPGFTRACGASSLREDRGSQWTPSSGMVRNTVNIAVRMSPLDSVHFESQGKSLYRAPWCTEIQCCIIRTRI